MGPALTCLNVCVRAVQGDYVLLNRALVEAMMAYTDGNGGACELRPWQLQYSGLGAPTWCVQRARRVEEEETNSIELIFRTEVKCKARNSLDSGRSVTGNGGGET